jgi:hypothetical protein
MNQAFLSRVTVSGDFLLVSGKHRNIDRPISCLPRPLCRIRYTFSVSGMAICNMKPRIHPLNAVDLLVHGRASTYASRGRLSKIDWDILDHVATFCDSSSGILCLLLNTEAHVRDV